MLESRYIPSKHIARVQAAPRGQRKTEVGIAEQGRNETLVLLQSRGAASQCLTEVLHPHQGLVKMHNLQRNLLLGLRTPAYKQLVEAGVVSDHLGFVSDVWEKGILLLEHVGSTGCLRVLPAYIRNVNCWRLISNCI